MKARTPLDELQFLGDEVAMPQPKYPVGTKIDPSRLDAESLAYYGSTMVRAILRDTQKIVGLFHNRLINRQPPDSPVSGRGVSPVSS